MYLPKAGDIFCFRITRSEMLAGRVLLDVRAQCIAPRRIAPDSQLVFFDEMLMVEVYGEPVPEPRVANGQILISSLFIDAGHFASGAWPVVGSVAVDPVAVDFPAATVGQKAQAHLSWGEIAVPMQMTFSEFLRLRFLHTRHSSGDLPAISLVALGRPGDIDPAVHSFGVDAYRLDGADLRYSPLGPELFAKAGLAKRRSYFEEAAARGFDTRRFYEPDPRVPFLVCPYCYSVRTPDVICWACGEDTSRDAAIEVTQEELDSMPKKSCPKCGTRIPELAIRCPQCRAEQPE